jgi:hypothetical protein
VNSTKSLAKPAVEPVVVQNADHESNAWLVAVHPELPQWLPASQIANDSNRVRLLTSPHFFGFPLLSL